jgi:hypothetical protein
MFTTAGHFSLFWSPCPSLQELCIIQESADGIVRFPPNGQAVWQTQVKFPQLLNQHILNSSIFWGRVLHPQPEDSLWRGDRDPLTSIYTIMYFISVFHVQISYEFRHLYNTFKRRISFVTFLTRNEWNLLFGINIEIMGQKTVTYDGI